MAEFNKLSFAEVFLQACINCCPANACRAALRKFHDFVLSTVVKGLFSKELFHIPGLFGICLFVIHVQGEKYFVLKKAKEAPAVLRKPPRPNTRKDRPVSLPPVFRGAKLEEMPSREGPLMPPVRSQSTDESPDLSHPNKENKPLDRSDGRDGKHLASTGSVDSGLDSDVSHLFIHVQ